MNGKKLGTLSALAASLVLSGCSNTMDTYTETPIMDHSEPATMETIFNDPTIVYSEEDVLQERNAILTEKSGRYSADAFLMQLTEEGVDLSVIERGTLHFGFDSSELNDEHKKLIEEHADLLKQAPELKVILEGHTDSTGDRSYNLKLGERRGLAVKEYAESIGVLSNQIEVISYGEEKLLNKELNEDERGQNRRAVFSYQ